MFHADNLFEFFYLRNFANKEIDMLQELYLSGNQLGAITCKNIGLVLSK